MTSPAPAPVPGQLPLAGFDLIEQIVAERRAGRTDEAGHLLDRPRRELAELAASGPSSVRTDARRAALGFQRAAELIDLLTAKRTAPPS